MTTWEAWKAHAEPMAFGDLEVATYDLGDPSGTGCTFLHGYPSSSQDIEPVLPFLDGWHVLTLDLPGFGASSKPIGHPHSIHAAADAVEALWAAKGVERTFVLAHDYSVSVAQELLARRDEGTLAATIDGVVFCNGGLWPDLHRQTIGQQLLLGDDGEAFSAGMTEELFVGGIPGTWGTRVPVDPDGLHEMWTALADGGGGTQMRAMLHYVADRREHQDRWRTALETTDLPLAFVWGDLDPVSGAHVMERLRERLGHHELNALEDVGHWPTLEAPDEVAGALRRLAEGA